MGEKSFWDSPVPGVDIPPDVETKVHYDHTGVATAAALNTHGSNTNSFGQEISTGTEEESFRSQFSPMDVFQVLYTVWMFWPVFAMFLCGGLLRVSLFKAFHMSCLTSRLSSHDRPRLDHRTRMGPANVADSIGTDVSDGSCSSDGTVLSSAKLTQSERRKRMKAALATQTKTEEIQSSENAVKGRKNSKSAHERGPVVAEEDFVLTDEENEVEKKAVVASTKKFRGIAFPGSEAYEMRRELDEGIAKSSDTSTSLLEKGLKVVLGSSLGVGESKRSKQVLVFD